MKILRIIGWAIAIAGVIITFGNLKGWFIDKNRQEIYRKLLSESSEYRVSIETPGVNTFLDKYYYSRKIPSDMQSLPIKGLTLKWMRIGGKGNPPMAGSVHVLFENEKRSTALCTLDELRQWANETPFYAWLGLWLMIAGVVVEIATDIHTFIKESRKSKQSSPADSLKINKL